MDVLGLTHFCRAKFGWDQDRVKQVLNPVLDGLEGKAAQSRLDAYFFEDGKFAEIGSLRIRQAVLGLTLMEPPEAPASSDKPRKKLKKMEDTDDVEQSTGQ